MHITVVQRLLSLRLGDTEGECIRLDPAQSNLGRLANDLSELAGELEVALTRHGGTLNGHDSSGAVAEVSETSADTRRRRFVVQSVLLIDGADKSAHTQ
jgi:hypothetical protein